ncbi:MAG: carboxypeptidase-like regulatory domain-containing protein, partial [Lysobacterales bacterium]
PEIIKVNCDVHNWMGGWIVVAASPYYVLTDEHGDFELDGVPAGTYTLKFWHEKLGEQTQAVVVKPNETIKVTTAFQGAQ